MKNFRSEQNKILAKQFHRTRRVGNFDNEIMSFHSYDRLPPDRLTWWDDVTFIINDYRVALAWTHPRMAFEDAIDSETDRQTEHLLREEFMRDGKPVYKTMGKSRKKIIHTVYEPLPESDFLGQWQKIRQQVLASTSIVIEPSLKSHWCKYSRLVNLCIPVEVRNENDLRYIVGLAKRLLKREVTLPDLFPNYRYTKSDWEREGLLSDGTDLHVHRIST